MGLASKIKNASSAPPTTPQPSRSTPVYDYPPPQQRSESHEASYGAPPPHYDYPPSAPPPPQQYYGAAYTAPHDYPLQPHQQSHVESTPYGVPGQTPPYPGQDHISPHYGEQVQTPYVAPPPNYMQPATGGFGPPQYQQTHASATTDMLSQKLQSIIQINKLQSFFDPARFQATLQKVSSINFDEIAAQWKISKELAYDLASLALYDIMFYCDDSGSMAFEENGERIDDLKFILSKVSGIATKFDEDGISVRFMNSNVNGDGIHHAADVETLISKVRFSGMTPLGTNLDRKIIQPFVLGQAMSNMAKPVLAIIITDGEPSGEDRGKIRQVIRHAKDALARTRYGGCAFAVQIAQVGKDANTQKFMESLDKDPVVGEMIDCTSYYEMEEEEFARKGVTLTPELWLLKMCVGAIDPEYDSKDT